MVLFEIGQDKRRTKTDITIEILKTCMDGANKTKIVYQSNLNFRMADEYLANLIKAGMIEQRAKGNKIKFYTTLKGDEILSKYRDIKNTINKGFFR